MGSVGLVGKTKRMSSSFSIGDPSISVSDFESYVGDQTLIDAMREYAYGTYGDEAAKQSFDTKYGISKFIDNNSSWALKRTTLYRGVVLSDAELSNLQVGKDANIKGLTSWTEREVVSHMYATGDMGGNTMGNKTGNAVVFVDSSTNDALPYPYTYPQSEALRSSSMKYVVTKIVPASQYSKPIGRQNDTTEYYTEPVTYVYVKHKRGK